MNPQVPQIEFVSTFEKHLKKASEFTDDDLMIGGKNKAKTKDGDANGVEKEEDEMEDLEDEDNENAAEVGD